MLYSVIQLIKYRMTKRESIYDPVKPIPALKGQFQGYKLGAKADFPG